MAVAERDESPYIQNPVNTDNVDAPEIPGPGADQIEREDNYATNEEINSLVEKVRSGQWRETQETQRLQARYGDRNLDTWWNQMRLLLGGEEDFTYDAATGTAHHNIGIEIGRRIGNVVWKTGKTAAIASLLGLATGGTGAVAGWMIGGSAIGRSFAEAWKGIAGHESRMREKILIARERYYQKAKELADRVPDVEPPNRAAMSERDLADYYKRRNAAIESLVNFIHDSEQNTVTFEQKNGGDLYIDTRVYGQPLPTRGEPGDPRMGGPSGPALNTGSEVYQSSKVAPTGNKETIDTLEKDLEKYNRKWEWIQEALALAGGIGGGIHALLTAKSHLAEQLARGEVVNMDLDHNGIYHGVQKVTEAMKQTFGITKDYIFHYNNSAEMLQAMADKATVLPTGEAGSHILNQTLAPTLMRAAWGELGRNAMTTLGALLARFAWRGAGTELGHRAFEERRDKMKVRHELERRRFQPEPRDSIVRNIAERELKPDFAIGQEWIFDDHDGNSHRIKIVDIVNRPPHQKLLVYTEFDPSLGTQIDPKTGEEKGLNVVRTVAPEDLLQRPGIDMVSERGKDPVLAHDPIPEPPKPAESEKKEEDKDKDKPKLKFKDGDKEVEKELADKQVVVLKAENKKDDRAYEYYEVTIDKDGAIHFQKFAFDADKKKRDNKGKPITFKKKEDMENWLKGRENKDKVKVDKIYDKFEDYEKSLKKED